MKNFVGVLRFIAYVVILHFVMTWLSTRLMLEIAEIPAGIDQWFGNGFWYWLWHDNRYMYSIILAFVVIIISVLFSLIIKVSYFPKVTKIFTYIYVGIRILIVSVFSLSYISSSSYSMGIQIISIVTAIFLMAAIFIPFLLVAYDFDEGFGSE